jgi:hypothetical protein
MENGRITQIKENEQGRKSEVGWWKERPGGRMCLRIVSETLQIAACSRYCYSFRDTWWDSIN